MCTPLKIVARFLSILPLIVIAGCGGSGGGYSSPPPPPPAPDTTPPTVSSVAVPPGSTVNRVVTLSVTASDDRGVTEVRFFVDGTMLGSDSSAPYSIDWDTSAETDGDHTLRAEAVDEAGNTAQSLELTVTVQNVVQFLVALNGDQELPPIATSGSAQADLTVNLVTGEVSGDLTVNGITATAAHIHDAFAGAAGGVLIGFEQDPNDDSLFSIPAGAVLDAAAVERLLAGALYLNVHSAEFQSGELRGQILTPDLEIRFAQLEGRQSVPRVDSVASGYAGITVNSASGALVVQATVSGLDDATQAHVHDAYAGDTGGVLVPLNQDPRNPERWFVEDGMLNAAGLSSYDAGRLYINVHSNDHPDGEIRGQIVPDDIALLFVEMMGDEEVPAIDSRARGLAAITLDEAASLLTINVNTSGLFDASGAHLHGGFGGSNGPVEVGLTQDGADSSHWFVEEELLDADQLSALLSGATYVNVHTASHQAGEIRGQVIPDGILFATGRLEGRQEVPPVDSMAGGTFAVTVDPDAMTLVVNANTTGAGDATAAHLHDEFAGLGGGVAISLTQDPNEASRWSADVDALSADHLAAFRNGRLYVNVHTPANPAGEIRGQVAPPPIEVLFSPLAGDQEVPAVTSAASGLAATTINRETGATTVHLHVGGADDAVAAHLHSGYAGQNGGVVVGLEQDAGDTGHWFLTDGQLGADALLDYREGRLYVNVHTPANQAGEIRGQMVPQNLQVVFSDMSGEQVVPPVMSAASGTVTTTVDLSRRSLVAFVNVVGADDATGVGIHVGGIGTNGDEILPLQQTMDIVSQWSAMTEPLSTANFSAYRAGRLYALLSTPAAVNGELRGQIVPPDAALFDDLPPAVTLDSPGDSVSGTVTLQAEASDDQGIAMVRFLADGVLIGSDDTAPYSVDWDTTAAANGQVTLVAEADDLAGNTGVSAAQIVTIDNPVPVTLTQIQAEVFGPICSGCHSGPTGNTLPSGMNLSSAANSYSALVNVPSLQVALDRVEPGDPDASYLIRKLEGGPDIMGSRMPQGGPFLDQATIDEIRQWITDGAPNN